MGRKKKIEPASSPTVHVPIHQVSRIEWDNTMRAALTGLIASAKPVGDGSYAQAVAHARIYALNAHGERP